VCHPPSLKKLGFLRVTAHGMCLLLCFIKRYCCSMKCIWKRLHRVAVRNLEKLGLNSCAESIHGDATEFCLRPGIAFCTFLIRSKVLYLIKHFKTIEPEGKRFLAVYNPVCDDIFCPCDPVGGRSCVGPVLRRSPPVVFQALPFVGRSPVQVLGWLS
jgi:hypothetical protein